MTKRIFALMTALIMAVTMLNLSVFAATGSASITDTGSNTVKIQWAYTADDEDSAVTYTYSLVNKTTGTTLKSGTKVSSTSVTGISYSASGTLVLTVDVYVDGTYKTTLTDAETVTYLSSSTSGGITVTQTSSSAVTVSWTGSSSYASYSIYYTTTSGGTNTIVTTSASYDLTVAYSSLKTVKVTGYSAAGATGTATTIGTWTNSSSSSSSTTGSVTVTYNGNTSSGCSYTFSWSSVSGAGGYYVAYSSSAGTGYNYTTSTSITSYLKSGYTYYITVTAYTGSSYSSMGTKVSTVGTASVTAGTTTSTTTDSNGVTATYNSTNSNGSYNYTFSWSSYSSSTAGYDIYVDGSYLSSTVSRSVVTSVASGSHTVYVYAYDTSHNRLGTVGYVTFTAGSSSSSSSSSSSGVTYANNGETTSGYYTYTISWGSVSNATFYVVNINSTPYYTTNTYYTATSLVSGTTYSVTVSAYNSSSGLIETVGSTSFVAGGTSASTSGTTTTGNNCTVVSGTSSKTLTWNALTGASYYVVTYFVDSNSTGSSLQTTSTSTVLPVANTSSVLVYVYGYDSSGDVVGLAASASVAATETSSSTTESKNVTISSSTASKTTLTWSAVSGAVYYKVVYGTIGLSGGVETYTATNSITVPYGSSSTFQTNVYAVSSSGDLTFVGYIKYYPGSSSSSSSSSDSVYPTTFKGTTGTSGKITLSWDAASDATSYTVYYKRTANSTWIKAGSTKKTAVNITGLTDGISYDFYITADTGYSSGTLTITPSTSTSSVTATDPTSSSTSTSTTTSLKSVTSSSSGSISVTWTAVSGATSYKVYVAEGSSTTYKSKGTFTGTSATITGLTSGTTYKVRVVAIPYTGTLASALKACDYMSVTVK